MYIITELSTVLHQLEHVSYETVGYLHVLLNKYKSQHFADRVWPSLSLRNFVNFVEMAILYFNTLDYTFEYSDILFEYWYIMK